LDIEPGHFLVISKRDTGLLIIGHGSTVNPHSSAPTLAHAAEIRRQGHFRDVRCAFWKEEPSLRDSLFAFDPQEVRNVYVVPNFISEGYFTQTVIPRELELTGATTIRSNGQRWHYCPPVGNNPSVTELLLKRAQEVAPNLDPGQTSLLIVAHGTDLNENSAVAAKREAGKIRALGGFAHVLNVYMEEPPLVADWQELTNTRNVVVVPFFVSAGLHSEDDVPRLLGIPAESTERAEVDREDRQTCKSVPKIPRRNPHYAGGRALYYAGAIGTDPRFAQIIVQQVTSFAEAKQLQSVL
jgi:sirohydrochlorin cobaltochelatase